MPDTIDSARKLITDRLRELEAETNQLERALKSMAGSDGARPARPKLGRKRATRRKRRRSRAPRGQRREQLLAAIGAKPGSRPAELAKEIGIPPSQVQSLIGKARAEVGADI